MNGRCTFGAVKGLPVVSLEQGGYLGKLDDMMIRLEDGRVLGFTVRAPGFFGGSRGVAAAEVVLLGREYVLVKSDASAVPAGDARGPADGRVWWSDWSASRCLARRGTELGRIEDVVLDVHPVALRALWLSGGHLLVPGPRVVLGEDSVIVEEESALSRVPEREESPGWWRVVGELLGA